MRCHRIGQIFSMGFWVGAGERGCAGGGCQPHGLC